MAEKVVKTGSMGRKVEDVKTVGTKTTGGTADEVDTTKEQVEKQRKEVPNADR